ncbi:MAG: hypothetical protein PHE27_02575 [Alphaproteobacteria bacterium]|nr:hypothetical protein [Alphaproteobacteria bacterium]
MNRFSSFAGEIKKIGADFKACVAEIGLPRAIAATAVTAASTLGGALAYSSSAVVNALPNHFDSPVLSVVLPPEVLTPANVTGYCLAAGATLGFGVGLCLAYPIVRNAKNRAALSQNRLG